MEIKELKEFSEKIVEIGYKEYESNGYFLESSREGSGVIIADITEYEVCGFYLTRNIADIYRLAKAVYDFCFNEDLNETIKELIDSDKIEDIKVISTYIKEKTELLVIIKKLENVITEKEYNLDEVLKNERIEILGTY